MTILSYRTPSKKQMIVNLAYLLVARQELKSFANFISFPGRRNRYSWRDGEKMTPTEDDNTDSASYIQTPKPGQKSSRKDLPNISQNGC